MTHRQTHSQPFPHSSSLLQQIKDLHLEIQLKNHQIDDLKFELNTLRKKQSIWHHLGQTYSKQNAEQQKNIYVEENSKLKSQIYTMLNQIQQKNSLLAEHKQKINDLKQYTQQLKKLNEKTQLIHQKEIEVLQSSICSSSEILQLKKDKEKLQCALSQCDIIGRQMEEYYMNEVETMKKQLEDKQNIIEELQQNRNRMANQLNRKERQLKEGRSKIIENESKWNQCNFSELLKKQNLQKKYEIIVNQIKQKYEKQISELKQQLHFLLTKVENLQQSKTCEGRTSSIRTQSKLTVQPVTNDSFRFTQNNSFSSSIKESLTKRDGPLRTPSKTCRKSNHFGFLLDRTNL